MNIKSKVDVAIIGGGIGGIMTAYRILDKNPDIMMHSYGHGDNENPTVEQILNRPGWQHLNFVQNKKVVGLEANLVNRYGPRSVDALELVAQAVHPELFN